MITVAWLWLTRRIGYGPAVLIALLLLILALWAATSAWSGLTTRYWRSEAKVSQAAAETAQANATSANVGAANATRTRVAMGTAVAIVHDQAEQAAQRIEAHEDLPLDPADRRPVDAASLRELEAARDRARAAADRLRGTR